jgi:hypothetical protein
MEWNGTTLFITNSVPTRQVVALMSTSFLTNHGVALGTGTAILGSTTAGSSGQVLVSNGASADPTFQAVSAAGAITQINGNSGAITPTAGVVTINGGSTGLTTSGASSTLSLTGTLGTANGGTGTSSTFTQGSVVFAGASGIYAQDNANFFWDDSNDRLGIGTNIPDYRICGFSAGTTTYNALKLAQSSSTAGNVTRITLVVSTDPTNDTNGGKVFIDGIRTSTNMDFAISLNSSAGAAPVERMRITGLGRVGIGTGSPAATLQSTRSSPGSGGVTPYFQVTPAADTSLTASTEAPISYYEFGAATRTWSTGSLTMQRYFRIDQPTIAFAGASTVTDVANLGVAGAPVKGSNATVTNAHAILVDAGAVSTASNSYGLTVNAQTGASNNYAAQFAGGNVGFRTSAPTAYVHMGAGTATASTAPLKFTSGTNLTAAEAGAMEFDGTLLYYTNSTPTRNTIAVLNQAQTWTAAQRGAFSTATDAATVTLDLSLANNFNLTLGGNRTLGVPTNIVAGQTGTISVRQDITGSRTLAFAWVWVFPLGASPTLSTAALSFDQLYYCVNNYATSTVTMTIASPCVVTWTAHGLVSGQRVQFTTTGALPTGVSANTTYWITRIDANSFNLSTSLANAQSATFVNTSGSQSGTHTAVACSITLSSNLALS